MKILPKQYFYDCLCDPDLSGEANFKIWLVIERLLRQKTARNDKIGVDLFVIMNQKKIF